MKQLRFNMCGIETSYKTNDKVPELQTRIIEKIPFQLDYTCQFWAQHLSEAPYTSALRDELLDFLNNRLLYWLEALSLLEKVKMAGPALLAAIRWTPVSSVKC